jgi:hypothetical protein
MEGGGTSLVERSTVACSAVVVAIAVVLDRAPTPPLLTEKAEARFPSANKLVHDDARAAAAAIFMVVEVLRMVYRFVQ